MSQPSLVVDDPRLQFQPRRRGRPKPHRSIEIPPTPYSERQDQPAERSPYSLKGTVRLLGSLQSLTERTRQSTSRNMILDPVTMNRIQNFPTQVWDEISRCLSPSMVQPLGRIITEFERTLDELDAYTPGCDNNSFNHVINLRLDSLILDIKWNVQMNMKIRKDTQIRPRIASSVTTTTSFFQDAHHVTINGGHFNQADPAPSDQYQWMFRILMIQNAVLFS